MVDSIKETINETVNQQAETPTNTKTKAVLNQAVADLSVAASIVHQVHWYMRGPGFLYLHPKMDELMDSLNAHLDVISERLITIGGDTERVEAAGSMQPPQEKRIQGRLPLFPIYFNVIIGNENMIQEMPDEFNKVLEVQRSWQTSEHSSAKRWSRS